MRMLWPLLFALVLFSCKVRSSNYPSTSSNVLSLVIDGESKHFDFAPIRDYLAGEGHTTTEIESIRAELPKTIEMADQIIVREDKDRKMSLVKGNEYFTTTVLICGKGQISFIIKGGAGLCMSINRDIVRWVSLRGGGFSAGGTIGVSLIIYSDFNVGRQVYKGFVLGAASGWLGGEGGYFKNKTFGRAMLLGYQAGAKVDFSGIMLSITTK